MTVRRRYSRIQKLLVATLLSVLVAGQVQAGLIITTSSGIAATGADGVSYIGPSGIAATGADGFLAFGPNGIAATGADGLLPAQAGSEGVTYTGPNGIAATGADGIAATGADGMLVTGANGIAATGADGTTINGVAAYFTHPTGIAATGADGSEFRGLTGIAATGADSFTIDKVNGLFIHSPQGIAATGADSVVITMADGSVVNVSPNGLTITGADGIAATGADGVNVTGATGIQILDLTGIAATGADSGANAIGLQSVDPELALTLDRLTDDSNVNAVITYHQLPSDSDVTDLVSFGVLGGTRYRALPMIAITATKQQILAISHLPAVRSIYGVRTLQLNSDPYMAPTGSTRVPTDQDLTTNNNNLPVSGRNVTVAVLDTGVDGTHPDLAGRMAQNVKVLDTQSLGVGFLNPINVENLPNSDLVGGHGTFVAGIIAGSGQASGGKYAGVAPGAKIMGISAGDLTLTFVLAGFDYLLQHAAQYNVKAVNCSFSADTVFDVNDPVNIATRMVTDAGVSVVFSAGNNGPGNNSLNPYAIAPWVISVGATDQNSHLADYSSRGAFASPLFKPTLVAPGTSLISLRALGLTGVEGLIGSDLSRVPLQYLLRYTTGSGTSFSAPQVTGTIALMNEANPTLQPAAIRDILQETATPLPNYYQHEVGAGMLNAYAATLAAAFPQRQFGLWRAVMNSGQAQFLNDPAVLFTGTVTPGQNSDTGVQIPANALQASIQIAWGPILSLNDLGLTVLKPGGSVAATSNALNVPGLTGKRERITLAQPAAGSWTARAFNTVGVGTTQNYSGALEVTRVQYSTLADIANLGASARSDVLQTMRTFAMSPIGNGFFPNLAVTRSSLAASMVKSGAVPQYLAATPRYNDVKDLLNRSFVESAQLRAGGALFPETAGTNCFKPNSAVDRVTAAVVLVRAAGLESEAQSNLGLPAVSDLLSIPAQWRPYVAVALNHGLLSKIGTQFKPNSSLTRVDLAHGLVVMQQISAS